jgi:hypothetical protein
LPIVFSDGKRPSFAKATRDREFQSQIGNRQ